MADRQAMMVGDKCWAWWEVILMQMRNDGVMEESDCRAYQNQGWPQAALTACWRSKSMPDCESWLQH